MQKLNKNPKYYFKNEITFSEPLDNSHYFVMENYEIGMHKQGFFEINIIIRGRGMHHIEGTEVDAEFGDVFIIPPEVEHGYTGGEGFDVYHILVNNKFMQKNIADLQQMDGFSMLFNVEPMMRGKVNRHFHLKMTEAQLGGIKPLLDERKHQRRFVSAEESAISTGCLYIIIAKLCQIYVENTAISNTDHNIRDAAFMRSLALIHERYCERITVEELAKEAMMSKSTYMRRFLQICRVTPAEYIIRKRIEVAENMLKNTNTPLSEISERIGFYDVAHFSRTFKKLKGVTPSQYRKAETERRLADS